MSTASRPVESMRPASDSQVTCAVCAEILLAAGRQAEAKAQAEKAAALFSGTVGAQHPDTVAARALARRCSATSFTQPPAPALQKTGTALEDHC